MDSDVELGDYFCLFALSLLIMEWNGITYVKIFEYKFQIMKESFYVCNKLLVVPISSTFSVFAGIS